MVLSSRLTAFYLSENRVQNRNYAFYAGVIYIASIFGLRRVMRNRQALDLKLPLFFWNLFLGIGSIVGFLYIAPGLLTEIFQPNGLYKSLCVKEEMDIPTMYWWILFALSKYVELGDTIFIVLRKRPLIFLQWYHHLFTLFATAITIPLGEPMLRWFGTCNTFVHSLMYPYFAMRAIGLNLPSPIGNLITTLQFLQMVVGFGINAASWYFNSIDSNCVRYPVSIVAYNILYGSFILLFGKLFYDLVIKREKKIRPKKEL